MHFLITAIGSYGDVHPMVGLGKSLRARGHRATVLASPYFTDVIEGAGLEMVPIGTIDDYLEMTQHPDLWHPRRSIPFVFREGAIRFGREAYQKLVDLHEPGNTVMVAHALDAAGRMLGETHSVPVSSVVYSPIGLWSNYHAPKAVGAWTGPRVPRWLNRLQFRIADWVFFHPHLTRPVNAIRKELRLPPIKRVFEEYWYNTNQVLCLFPDWFGPPQPDWPNNVELVGFPLWDGGKEQPLAREVVEFLDAGEPPIVFTPGSANREAKQFLAVAAETCERLGKRGILLTKFTEQLPPSLSNEVRHFSFVPLSRLLPRAAAFVHHAGIGSCSQGLAAGVPQLAQPMAFDQPDNVDRLVRLGVARALPPKKFTVTAVSAALGQLLHGETIAKRCHELADRCRSDRPIERACDALERLVDRPSHASATAIAN